LYRYFAIRCFDLALVLELIFVARILRDPILNC
jgi:hypothetical protein